MHIQLILLIILIILSAFFSLSEAAHRLLVTILVGNNLVNISASAIATALAITLFKENAIGISIGAMTFLLLVFGEIMPKNIAIRYNTQLSLFVSKPIWYMSIILTPLIKLFEWFTEFCFTLVGIKRVETQKVTEEDIKNIVKIGEEEGAIDYLEKELIERVFRFDDIEVRRIMKPKSEIKSIHSDTSLKDFIDIATEYKYSRYPIHEKNPLDIIGVALVKDALSRIKSGNPDLKVKDISLKPRFVFSNKKVDDLLRLFQKLNEQMAFVINDKAQVIGLVTLEDVLEEIVGDIVDETERIKPKIQKIDDKTWRIHANTDIDKLNKELKLNIKSSEEYLTIEGYVLTKLGRNPKQNELVDFGNYSVTAEIIDKNKGVNKFILILK